ncbi:MAG: hypothetical protein GOU98_03985 [Candidatus Altiarchaeota archaeon]|nr:hypothetical protein [Candidatus Altiarchaeota archaeon]
MIVCLGGGKGLSSTTRALKLKDIDFGAVVTTSDNGGSTGLLRRKYGIPAVGDFRRVIGHLNTSPFSEIMESRYEGHALGNLVILDFVKKLGFKKGLEHYRKAMKVDVNVYPQFIDSNDLVAEISEKKVKGELQIDETKGELQRLWFEPEIELNPDALNLIESADAIILGPGSLYTSIIPHLLVPEQRKAINSVSTKLFVMGIKNDVPLISHYKASDYIKKIEKYVKLSSILIQSPQRGIEIDTRDQRIVMCDVAQDNHMHNPLRLGEELWKVLK